MPNPSNSDGNASTWARRSSTRQLSGDDVPRELTRVAEQLAGLLCVGPAGRVHRADDPQRDVLAAVPQQPHAPAPPPAGSCAAARCRRRAPSAGRTGPPGSPRSRSANPGSTASGTTRHPVRVHPVPARAGPAGCTRCRPRRAPRAARTREPRRGSAAGWRSGSHSAARSSSKDRSCTATTAGTAEQRGGVLHQHRRRPSRRTARGRSQTEPAGAAARDLHPLAGRQPAGAGRRPRPRRSRRRRSCRGRRGRAGAAASDRAHDSLPV